MKTRSGGERTVGGDDRQNRLSTKHILIPAAVILLFLHTFIIVNTIRINRMGQRISSITQRSFSYTQIAKEFESGSDILADRARLYVSTGAPQYIDEYFRQWELMERQDTATLELMMGNANENAYAAIEAAVAAAGARAEIECLAMRLCAELYQTDLTPFPKLAELELTGPQSALPPAGRYAMAEELLFSKEYLQIRTTTREYIDTAVGIVSAESSASLAEQAQVLRGYQILQWLTTGSIILLIFVVAGLLLRMLIIPLERGVARVRGGEPLDAERGVSEYRDLANAYNELLYRRRMTEDYLRKQTQTDALTGLPNRLAFQNHITDLSWNKAHSAVTAFSLDVSGLRETNDAKGHAAGDALLRSAAEAIRAAFGGGAGRECFRFGGDEFAAFWVDAPQEEAERAVTRFQSEQAARNVSVSVGYAYAADLSETSAEELLAQADKAMYENKARRRTPFFNEM